MPVLEVEGAFAMLVPDGWTATLHGATYELVRAGDDGAAHLSVHDRHDAPLRSDEAARLIELFVDNISPEGAWSVRVLPESDDQHRAVARFRAGEFEWLVFLVLWRTRFLMCSCNAAPGSPLVGEAERMFATIHQPEVTRKRFRWRK